MKPLNPELTTQLGELADMIGRKLDRQDFDLQETAKPYLEALARGGFARMSDVNLQVRLEKLVLEKVPESAIHRRREISAIAGELQRTFDRIVSFDTNQPTPPEDDLTRIRGSATK